jgi:hypothetical protein
MPSSPPALAIVPALLDTITEVAGCNVDCLQLSVDAGACLFLDVLDHSFEGKIDREILTAALIRCLSPATGMPVVEGGACVSEGGTVSLRVFWEPTNEITLQVGV